MYESHAISALLLSSILSNTKLFEYISNSFISMHINNLNREKCAYDYKLEVRSEIKKIVNS